MIQVLLFPVIDENSFRAGTEISFIECHSFILPVTAAF